MKTDSGSAAFNRMFTHHTVEVNGVRLHYVVGGSGDPVVLLHGYPYTWYVWRKLMPLLAERHTVFAPDLRGTGDSEKPAGGYEKRNVAEDIYQLTNQLGFGRINSFFGQIAQNGAVNVRGLQPSLTLQLTRNLSIVADTYFFWRDSTRDGLYGVPGNLLRTGQRTHARYIGTQPGAELTWAVDRHATVKVFYAYFFAGRFLRETPPGRDINFFGAEISYRF